MEDLNALESRVNKLEYIFGQGAEDTVRKVQLEMLQDLYKLREALKEDLKEGKSVPASDSAPLLAEIKKLQEENAKLHYRIKHLKKYID
jgi:DNA anti-recombination protein RmuC